MLQLSRLCLLANFPASTITGRGTVDIKMAASKFFLSLMIFLTSHGKSRGRENTSLFYYNSEKCRRLLKQEINERRLHADKQLYAY